MNIYEEDTKKVMERLQTNEKEVIEFKKKLKSDPQSPSIFATPQKENIFLENDGSYSSSPLRTKAKEEKLKTDKNITLTNYTEH